MGQAEPRIVVEDPVFLVVAKPAGMHTAPLTGGEAGTLLGWVLERFPEVGRVPGRKPVEPGLLHRLDRDTSGLVLVARTASAWEALGAAAHSGGFLKRYRALVSLSDRPPEGTRALLAPLGPRLAQAEGPAAPALPFVIESGFRAWGPGRRRVAAVAPGRARAYRTRLLELHPADEATRAAFSVLVELEAGFRHQVRVHLAAVGLPILGDALYGPPDRPTAPRLYLHACGLQFPHPVSRRTVVVTHEAF